MASLNISIPEQLRDWVKSQVEVGKYSSASDYLRDLIRKDKRNQEEHWEWLAHHLQPLVDTPDDQFVHLSADDIKRRARQRLKDKV